MYCPTRGLRRTLLNCVREPCDFQIREVDVWQELANQTKPNLTVPTSRKHLFASATPAMALLWFLPSSFTGWALYLGGLKATLFN